MCISPLQGFSCSRGCLREFANLLIQLAERPQCSQRTEIPDQLWDALYSGMGLKPCTPASPKTAGLLERREQNRFRIFELLHILQPGQVQGVASSWISSGAPDAVFVEKQPSLKHAHGYDAYIRRKRLPVRKLPNGVVDFGSTIFVAFPFGVPVDEKQVTRVQSHRLRDSIRQASGWIAQPAQVRPLRPDLAGFHMLSQQPVQNRRQRTIGRTITEQGIPDLNHRRAP